MVRSLNSYQKVFLGLVSSEFDIVARWLICGLDSLGLGIADLIGNLVDLIGSLIDLFLCLDKK